MTIVEFNYVRSKTNINHKLKVIFSKQAIGYNDCKVSRASSEIMLNRVFGGNKLEFPFSN